MNGIVEWFQQLRFDSIFDTLLVVVASLLCITIHETCHGLVAYWLGDPTAKRSGRLTLNPIKHVDPLGLIMMAVLKFGWAKPVPVDMRRFRKPRRDMALTALAGPFSNLVLALLALLLRSVVWFFFIQYQNSGLLANMVLFLEYVAILSAGLAIFNLIPISPLDGSKIIFSLLPDRAYQWLLHYERYGMFLLLAVMAFGWFDGPLITARDYLIWGMQQITAFPFYWLCNLFL